MLVALYLLCLPTFSRATILVALAKKQTLLYKCFFVSSL